MTDQDFRWRAFFQRCTEPLFLLNRQCYLLFVNRAWEQLAGLAAGQVKRLYCRRPQAAGPQDSWRAVLAHTLTPPAEVLEGTPGRQRRLIPGRDGRPPVWWDVDFFPFRDDEGFRGTLGRITPVPATAALPAAPLPEAVVALRQRRLQRHSDLFLGSRLPAMRRVEEQVRLASRLAVPVLLVGAAGTGKETLARLIHYRGPAAERAFAALDCRRLPAYAVGALLLGESGAAARAPLAAVYLKEPGCLPREMQARLCEWLTGPAAEGRAVPRLLAGCRGDPGEEVARGRLLEEFCHALGTFRIDVPSLAQRRDDLPHLIDRMLRRLGGDGGRAVTGLTPDAWEVVLAYAWPGNLRELYATLQSARQHASGDALDAPDLPAYVRRLVRLEGEPGPRAERVLPHDQLLEKVERHLIVMCLQRARGNRTKAAELLAMSRPRLLRRMQELGIEEGEESKS
jgi:DNA-binding NtrC family response regulator